MHRTASPHDRAMSWSSISTNPATGTVLNVGSPFESGIEAAFDATGMNGVIAWNQSGETSLARRLVNGVWQSVETLWAAEPQTHRVVCAFIDDTGAPCVALSRGGWYFATLHRYASGSWSQVSSEFGGSGGAATGVDFPDSSEPTVALTLTYGGTNNRSFAILFKSRDGVRVARQVNGSWLTSTLLASTSLGATVGAFLKVSAGEWHAIVRLSDNRVAHYKTTDYGANWTSGTIISDASNLATDVRASLLSDGSILAVWSKTTGSGATAWSLLSGGSWTPPASITGPSDAITTGNVNFAADTLTYGKSVSGVFQIFGRTFSGAAWGPEEQLTAEASSISRHSFGAMPNGNEAVLAYQAGASIKLRRRVYGNWRTAESFSASSFWPQVAASATGIGVHSGLLPQALTLDTTVPQQLSGRAVVNGTQTTLVYATERNMTSATDVTETAIGNALLRGQNITGAGQLYVALFTAYPGEAGSTAAEVTGGGYSRQPVSFGAANPAGTYANDTACVFSPATSSWGTVSFIGLMSAATAGHMVLAFPLTDSSGDATSQAIGIGDRPEIAVGELTIEIS